MQSASLIPVGRGAKTKEKHVDRRPDKQMICMWCIGTAKLHNGRCESASGSQDFPDSLPVILLLK